MPLSRVKTWSFDFTFSWNYTYGMRHITKLVLFTGFFLLTSLTGFASDTDFNPNPDFAQVKSVRVVYRSNGRWDIHVSVLHNDEGWNHYADVWQVVDSASGEIIGERVLAHPHDNEQPFTRSLSGLEISEDIREVFIRSRCNLHGFEGKVISFEIPKNPVKGGFSIVLE